MASQLLTLFAAPVIYLAFEKAAAAIRRLGKAPAAGSGGDSPAGGPSASPAPAE